jgi:hypothetical protein
MDELWNFTKGTVSKYLASGKMLLDSFQRACYYSHVYPCLIVIHMPSHRTLNDLRSSNVINL